MTNSPMDLLLETIFKAMPLLSAAANRTKNSQIKFGYMICSKGILFLAQ